MGKITACEHADEKDPVTIRDQEKDRENCLSRWKGVGMKVHVEVLDSEERRERVHLCHSLKGRVYGTDTDRRVDVVVGGYGYCLIISLCSLQ